jgi:hypothetical protein
MISDETRPRPAPRAVWREVDSEAIIVLPDQGQFKVLNAVGGRVWQLADGTRTVTQIAQSICAEYDVAADIALRDVRAFIEALVTKGALIIGEK